MFKRKVRVPTTLQEFDDLVTLVGRKYKLEDLHHAAAIISVALRHLPNDQAYTSLDYLGHSILKNISNYVCNHKAEVLKHGAQVEHLVALLKKDPNDQQVRDELTKAADEGSESAKNALSKLEEPSATVIAG